MTTIQFAPWRRAPVLLLVASLSVGIVTHALFNGLIRTGEQRVLAVLLCSVVAGAGFVLALHLTYPRFAFDTVSRTARMGRRTVPLDSVREAWRSYQSGSNGATYLIYRFRSTEGPAVKVLVAGRPLRGLDDAGRAALADFLRIAPIAGPDAAAEAQRGSLASDLLGDGTRVPVSAAMLLFDLGGAGIPSSAAAPRSPEPGDAAASRADDLEAIATLTADGAGVRYARVRAARAFGVVTLLLPAAGGLLVLAAILGWDLDDRALVAILGVPVLLLGAVGLVWSILGDLDTATIRRASLTWLTMADDDARKRGLPAVFHQAWLQFAPGHRVLTILAFGGGLLGVLLVLLGLVALTTDDPLVVLLALPGALFAGLAIRFWIRHRRRRRADVVWLLEAAGPRSGLR